MSKKPKKSNSKTWVADKPEGYRYFEGTPRKIGFWKGLGATIFGLSISAMLGVAGVVFYNSQVLYPKELTVKEENTGRYALSKYQGYLSSYSTDELTSFTGSSYLASEAKLQNGNEDRLNFIKTVLSTVKYNPLTVDALNKYGSVYYKPGTNKETKQDLSLVNFGEKVDFTYVDYSKINFNSKVINQMMSEAKIKPTDDNFVEEITTLFAKYISNLGASNLPTKTEQRSVPLNKGDNGYTVDGSEDEYLDSLLFSSKDLYDALDRFSFLALQGTEIESKEHKEWAAKPKEERANFEEPYKWEKYKFIRHDWLGVSALTQKEGKKPEEYTYPVGTGTKESPAGLNTPITTVALVKDDKGKDIKVPIRVTLIKVTYGTDAIKDIMKANIRNRGLDPKSDNKYIYTEWKVENLSSQKVSFESNSALSDSEANISPRTGIMYGLKDYAELGPYEYVVLQDWYASTELKEKYLIWGKNFNKTVQPIWYQVLKASPTEVIIPDDPIQTDDVSSVKNNEGTEKE